MNFRCWMFILFAIFSQGCIFFKGRFSEDGSMFIWNKDPEGRYNAHPTLKLEEAIQWIESIKPFYKLKEIKISSTSKKWDHYDLNDSILFFKDGRKELPNYHHYKAFAQRLDIEPEQLKKIIFDFDKLGLNRFYREEEYFAFETQTYLGWEKGYLYFIKPVAAIKENDTIDLLQEKEPEHFRSPVIYRFLIIRKLNDHWFEYKSVDRWK